LNRRAFVGASLRASALAAASTAVPRPLLAYFGTKGEAVPPIEDPRLQALAARALDSARGAGATYADVRLTHTRTRRFFSLFVYDEEDMEVGVRAFVNGYWGFASGPVWSPDEMARLGREAVHQAKTNAQGERRDTVLVQTPAVTGHWVMPVARDPLAISPFEIQDDLMSLEIFLHRTPDTGLHLNSAIATVQDKAFASMDGSYCTQRLYQTAGGFVVGIVVNKREGEFGLDCLSYSSLGWELYSADTLPRIRHQSLRDEIRQRLEEAKEDLRLPVKPVNVGRYDAVLDAVSVARMLDATLGRATELDRAFGFEANASGTSYLSDPVGMLGTQQIGAPLMTVTANRSEGGGAATVQWDDEGVAPDDFTLVKAGVLTDFQTTRESASWLKRDRSHGCANAPSAVYAPMPHVPNLMLAPGQNGGDFDALVSGTADGIAIKGLSLEMDFQSAGGLGLGNMFQVKAGKRVAQLPAAGVLFRSTDLWKSLQAVGAEPHLRRFGLLGTKGEPPQTCAHSVTAAPAVIKGLTLIDSLRKA
jgi:TldD protein